MRFFSQQTLMVLVVWVTCTQVGCQPPQSSSEFNQAQKSLPVVSGSELPDFIQQSEMPVLVELGVDYNCPRCQQVKSDVIQLGDRLAGRVEVIRVDFNANAGLVAQLGGTECPTYVLFQNGDPVLTRSFPLSIDLLESEVERLVSQ
ncbi:MAG: thioredoxin domain-containing protein [Pirellulaceae bacterium]